MWEEYDPCARYIERGFPWEAWHCVQQINSDKINQCNLKAEMILSGEACCLKIMPTFLPVLTVPASKAETRKLNFVETRRSEKGIK